MAQIWKSRAASHCDGNVAIEFGFILPVLLLFTLGIMDAGRLVWTYITLSRAADAAARCGAIDQTGTCTNIPAYAATQAWGINGITAAAFTLPAPTCTNGVQVNATYTFQFIVPWFPQFGSSAPFGANTMPLTATACYTKQY
jgi:Flp pilus assembly protein TadG